MGGGGGGERGSKSAKGDSQVPSMFISSLWEVKEPTHYSRRVGDEVPGVVAVLFSPAEVAGLAVMSKKGLWCMRPLKQEQP